MRLLTRLWNRLNSSRIQREIDEELSFHVDMLVGDRQRIGDDHRTARKRALQRFGSFERLRAECSSVYGLTRAMSPNRGTAMQNLWQDARYGVRNLFRQPAFSLVAISTLGVGIAASTVIFSAVNSTLLNPVPFADGDRMARVWHLSPSGGMSFAPDPIVINTWRVGAHTIEQLATWGSESMLVRLDGEPERITVATASVELFEFLGIQPIVGRAFQPADTVEGQHHVVMLAERHWIRQYDRDRSIIGSAITLNDQPYTIVGVAPRLADAFFPYDRNSPLDYSFIIPGRNDRATMVKIRPGVTVSEVERELGTLYERIDAEVDTPRDWPIDIRRPIESVSSSLRVGLWVLLGAVGFVLLVACINVANMLLVRGVARSHELALRQSLGAGTIRMVRQLLVESLFITSAATTIALCMTFPVLEFVRNHAPEGLNALRDVRFDLPVLIAAIAVTAIITIAFGLVPLAHVRRLNLTALFNGGRSGNATPLRSGLRSALVAIEVAMATVLFVGAGLMTRTLIQLSQHSPGFQATNLITFRIHLPESQYPNTPARDGFIRDLRERLGALPTVQRVAVGGIGVMGAREAAIHPEGAVERAPSRLLMVNLVSDGFFQTMATPIRGRGFSEAEISAKTGNVIVVNEAFERTYFPGESAVGRRLQIDAEGDWMTVVGVVPDVHLSGMSHDTETLQIYHPHHVWDLPTRPFVVRTAGDPSSIIALLKGAVWSIDHNLPLHNVEIATEMLSDAIARPRFNAFVMTAFALSGLLLAAVGVYTVVSMAQQHRRHELGVRIALGADRHDTLRLMLGYGMKPVAVGAGIGLLAAAGLSRVMRSLLFEVTPLDPVTYAAVLATLVLAALAASLLPARKALQVDPVEVLRCQ